MANGEIFDLVIVGAGISGIGMAARLAMQCPGKSYVMLDRREAIGGTWDLFRYPGIRSDSDMHTFAFDFEPWTDADTIASAEQITGYLGRVVDKYGMAPHMRFDQMVESADWDSAAALWRVKVKTGGKGKTQEIACRFLFLGTGYYDYDNPHDAEIPSLSAFKGKVIHPQFWDEEYDYTGKRVVIIGSGATAVSVVPAMAEKAAHVTMLQRTPTWYGVRPRQDKMANRLRKFLPEKWAWKINRAVAQRLHEYLFHRARNRPAGVAAFLQNQLKQHLGEAYNAADYTPPYNPWEQRLCLVPDGDMFKAIREGHASVVTGTIDKVMKDGIKLKDGTKLEADVIVTATGLRLATFGKINVSLDGKPIEIARHFWYRNCMFSNVPNLAVSFGYLNTSWTQRVGLVTEYLCKLFRHMDKWGVAVVTPTLAEDHGLEEVQPVDMFSSGYLQRGKHLIPRSTSSAPWRLHMFYREDKKEMAEAQINDGWLKFERRSEKAAA